jgi:type VI secretion system protein ImpM
MRFGLFGKMQAKRDFIAVATPRAFLSAWEPWLQGGMSASRMQMGEGWQNAFLTAPIWRFWLGEDICGTVVTGAIMASMDGVGRYFPLTLTAFAEEGDACPPPEIDPREAWFAAIEDFLIATLDTGRSFEETTAALGRLPQESAQPETPASVASLAPFAGMRAGAIDGFAEAFRQTRLADSRRAYAGMSFWWTAGGKDYDPLAIAVPRMPDSNLFAGMLTGDFSAASLRMDGES